MESDPNDYHFSFFKPTTDSARRNRNMVVQLVLIWAVAIFGFQVLLKVLEKPTPEPAWDIYQSVWGEIEAGSTDPNLLKKASQSALSVLGKVAIDPVHREALDNMISWSAFNIADDNSYRFSEIVYKIANLYNKTYPKLKVPNYLLPIVLPIINTYLLFKKIRPLIGFDHINNLISSWYLDTSKAKVILGYKPLISLDEGLLRIAKGQNIIKNKLGKT